MIMIFYELLMKFIFTKEKCMYNNIIHVGNTKQ